MVAALRGRDRKGVLIPGREHCSCCCWAGSWAAGQAIPPGSGTGLSVFKNKTSATGECRNGLDVQSSGLASFSAVDRISF